MLQLAVVIHKVKKMLEILNPWRTRRATKDEDEHDEDGEDHEHVDADVDAESRDADGAEASGEHIRSPVLSSFVGQTPTNIVGMSEASRR